MAVRVQELDASDDTLQRDGARHVEFTGERMVGRDRPRHEGNRDTRLQHAPEMQGHAEIIAVVVGFAMQSNLISGR